MLNGNLNLFPLSHHQKRILNIENLYPETAINHIGGLIQINGKLHLETLKKPFSIVSDRQSPSEYAS